MKSHRAYRLLLLAGFCAGIVAGRAYTPAAAPANSSEHGSASSAPTSATLPAAPPPSAQAARVPDVPAAAAKPLPPTDAPIAGYVDELAARAKAGDAAAAQRLADDVATCALMRRDLDAAAKRVEEAREDHADDPAAEALALSKADRLLRGYESTQARCRGLAITAAGERDWIALAARNGDPESMLCYGLFSGDWYPEPLSPDWLAHVDLYRANAVGYVQRSYAGGVAEAAAVLSQMYVPAHPIYDHRWAGRLGDDPFRALAYGYVAAATLSGKRAELWNAKVAALAAKLPPERAAEARRWADAQRQAIAFREASTPDLWRHQRCAYLRFRASQ